MNYVWAMDLSLSNTGISFFTDDGKYVCSKSIETKASQSTQQRLGKIGDEIVKMMEEYPPSKIVVENGFTRFNTSTQQLYRVHGLVNYLLRQYDQIYFASTTIKKEIGGKGNLKKEELRDIIKTRYNIVGFQNLDESDSFAIGMTYFLKNKIKGDIV